MFLDSMEAFTAVEGRLDRALDPASSSSRGNGDGNKDGLGEAIDGFLNGEGLGGDMLWWKKAT